MSLTDAIKKVTTENLIELIAFSDKELSKLLGRRPKLAVAGLNPHASEGGMFGDEETTQIAPAVKTCQVNGIDVTMRTYRGAHLVPRSGCAARNSANASASNSTPGPSSSAAMTWSPVRTSGTG